MSFKKMVLVTAEELKPSRDSRSQLHIGITYRSYRHPQTEIAEKASSLHLLTQTPQRQSPDP